MTPPAEIADYNFVVSGLYDGLFIMEDKQTKSLWNHMTGQGVYGKHAGEQIPVSNLLHLNVRQALEMDPNMQLAMSERPYNSGSDSAAATYTPGDTSAALMPIFIETLGEEDNRRPRMDLGLGVWTDDTQRYYSVEVLRANGNRIIDEIDGRNLLVFLEPLTSTPSAVYWEGDSVTLSGREFELDNGYSIKNSQFFDQSGERVTVEQPMQIFTRWYGFALTFPETEVVE